MFNKDVRAYAKEKNVYFWQIAEAMKISEPTMTRRLRAELSDKDKAIFKSHIDEISQRNAAINNA